MSFFLKTRKNTNYNKKDQEKRGKNDTNINK